MARLTGHKYSSLNKRFEELELSINHSLDYAHDTATQAFASTGVNSVSIIKLKEHCTDLECRLKMAEQKNKTLEERVIYQECQTRRDNLLFFGIQENTQETENDSKKLVLSMLEDIEVPDYSDIKIVRCHRNGVKQPGSNRPLIAKFHWFGDIQTILSKKSALKKPFLITQDWSKEIQKKRRMLLQSMHRAKEKGYRAKVSVDKLYVDGKLYTIGTLNSLPEDINQAKLCVKIKEDCVITWGKPSIFSAFHESTFKVNHTIYKTLEQGLQHQKALLSGDSATAVEVRNQADPYLCRVLGRKVTDFSEDKWSDQCFDIMCELIEAKSDQSEDIKKHYLTRVTNELLSLGFVSVFGELVLL